ncbi:hypothetical protein ABZ547_37710 [Streptomyces sparsogenes]|uniref:hypothetical protein n=1 Tax=Streptomyces sparsogenes TaxID=67365 RepID=UPI0033C6C330
MRRGQKIVLAESLDQALALKARHPDGAAVKEEATARLLRTRKCDSFTFVVTGEDGQADEDLACAQYISRRATEARTHAAESLRRAAGSQAAAELAEGVRQGVHPDDVALCLELDRLPFAMVATLEDSLMVLRPCAVPPLTDEAST